MDLHAARAMVAEYQKAEEAWGDIDRRNTANLMTPGNGLWQLEAGARRYAKLPDRDPGLPVTAEEIMASLLALTFPDIGEALAVIAAHDGEAEEGETA